MITTHSTKQPEKIHFRMPVIFLIRAAADETLLTKIKQPSFSYSISQSHYAVLQERAKQEHTSFEKILFEDVKKTFKESEIIKFTMEQFTWKYPQYKQVNIDLKLNGKITKEKEGEKGSSIIDKWSVEHHTYLSKKNILLRAFYLFLLITFILAFIGVLYSAFHQ